MTPWEVNRVWTGLKIHRKSPEHGKIPLKIRVVFFSSNKVLTKFQAIWTSGDTRIKIQLVVFRILSFYVSLIFIPGAYGIQMRQT